MAISGDMLERKLRNVRGKALHDINQVLVLRDGKCAGLVSRSDILAHLQLSQELGLKQKGGPNV